MTSRNFSLIDYSDEGHELVLEENLIPPGTLLCVKVKDHYARVFCVLRSFSPAKTYHEECSLIDTDLSTSDFLDTLCETSKITELNTSDIFMYAI